MLHLMDGCLLACLLGVVGNVCVICSIYLFRKQMDGIWELSCSIIEVPIYLLLMYHQKSSASIVVQRFVCYTSFFFECDSYLPYLCTALGHLPDLEILNMCTTIILNSFTKSIVHRPRICSLAFRPLFYSRMNK